MKFIHSVQSEWYKTKRSAASWLCIVGGFFIPIIYFIAFLKNQNSINDYDSKINIWDNLFMQLWSNMGTFILPMGLILASSLLTQMEFKNNTWKQLHTTPQSYTNIFFAKFSVLLLMTLKFFIFFNIGMILTGLLPCLIFDHQLPKEAIPIKNFAMGNLKIFVASMPLLALQYLLSLKFKNFLVPVGIGLMGLIGTLIGIQWKYIFISPYSYAPLLFMKGVSKINIFLYAGIPFILIMTISYFLYIAKKEKG
ncbi:MAG: ABC transporter permease [Bacteroidetes bacterium]|nr:ABC transporter permease [Bacteroidota bacterium]